MERTVAITKRMLAFDIDHTLCDSKQPMPGEMARLLAKLLEKFEICVVSGRSYAQFLEQVVSRLPVIETELWTHLHLLPAQGTQYYHWDKNWERVYAHFLREEDVSQIFAVVEQAARELGLWREENRENGDKVLENRESQVTFAAVDTGATKEEKRAFDPDCSKREAMILRMSEIAPKFEYRLGGSSSIDITLAGMDKGYGMRKLMEQLEIAKSEILYFGDMTQPGGNDYPVVELGIDTVTVERWEDTKFALEAILGVLGMLEPTR